MKKKGLGTSNEERGKAILERSLIPDCLLPDLLIPVT